MAVLSGLAIGFCCGRVNGCFPLVLPKGTSTIFTAPYQGHGTDSPLGLLNAGGLGEAIVFIPSITAS